MHEVLVVGGGPAGMAAALALGRARRRVLLIDGDEPRLGDGRTRRGVVMVDDDVVSASGQLDRIDLLAYRTIDVHAGSVSAIARDGDRFVARLHDESHAEARRVILATGVRDELSPIHGLAEMWGRGVYPFPEYDGWDQRDRPLAVLGAGTAGAEMAAQVRQLTGDVVLLTNGPAEIDGRDLALLRDRGIAVRETPVAWVVGGAGGLERIGFVHGTELARSALFLRPRVRPRTDLADGLGCALTTDGPSVGLIRVDAMGRTSVPGVYAAGDVANPLRRRVVAAGSGTGAGIAASIDLVHSRLGHRTP